MVQGTVIDGATFVPSREVQQASPKLRRITFILGTGTLKNPTKLPVTHYRHTLGS